MNDYFLRQAINSLAGLSKYTTESSGDVALVDATWVDLYGEQDISEATFISAYNITRNLNGGTVNNLEMRLLAAPTSETYATLGTAHKVFPFNPTTGVNSGSVYNIKDLVRIPLNHHFKIQVRADITGAPTAKLEYTSLIRFSTLNHS
jgi:hypothetical protein